MWLPQVQGSFYDKESDQLSQHVMIACNMTAIFSPRLSKLVGSIKLQFSYYIYLPHWLAGSSMMQLQQMTHPTKKLFCFGMIFIKYSSWRQSEILILCLSTHSKNYHQVWWKLYMMVIQVDQWILCPKIIIHVFQHFFLWFWASAEQYVLRLCCS